MTRIAIFASGAGSNAENIFEYFRTTLDVEVALLLVDNPDARVLARMALDRVPRVVVPRADFRAGGEQALAMMDEFRIDFIVLAGFLSLIPPALVERFRGRIVNVHPALLPAYGGKGMYGMRVHEAVVAAGERESGITVHHVDEHFDSGAIIAQFRVLLDEGETPASLAAKIHLLEQTHFPQVIERVIINH